MKDTPLVENPQDPEELNEQQLRQLLLKRYQEKHAERLAEFLQGEKDQRSNPGEHGLTRTKHSQLIEKFKKRFQLGRQRQRSKAQKTIDRWLTVLEVIGVIILALLIYKGFQSIQRINAQAELSFDRLTPPAPGVTHAVPTAKLTFTSIPTNTLTFTPTPLPTLTPTSTLQATKTGSITPEATYTPATTQALLPSGHEPPTVEHTTGITPTEGHTNSNVADMTPTPTPQPEQALWIRIPAIGVDHPVVMGDDWESLKTGVGQHPGSADPGEDGNLVLSAHNDIYGRIFQHLDQLDLGDEITILTTTRSYVYLVDEIRILKPSEISVLERGDKAVLTLISCYPYMIDTHRIVVRASPKPNLD